MQLERAFVMALAAMLSAAEVLMMPRGNAARAAPASHDPASTVRFSNLTSHTFRSGGGIDAQLRCACQRMTRAATSAGMAQASGRPDVVLTREAGKNGEMARRLWDLSLDVLELPLVETGEGPDREQLVDVLGVSEFDWVIITSPESAAVFIEGWKAAGQPEVNIAVVGTGTGRVLEEEGAATLQPQFIPSQADAVHLSAELPCAGSNCRVLYPASAKAGSDLQMGLAARGIDVMRLNTYTTRQVSSISDDALRLARQARVLAIASPSAIKAWAHIAGLDTCPAVACIGSTSAKAARALGLTDVYSPEKPGLDGFVDSIMEALSAARAPSAA